MASSDQLKVDLTGLEDLAGTLDRIRDGLNSTGRWILQFTGDLGGDDVDDALEDFESHWSDGRSRVEKNCERLAKSAKQAVEHFRKADDELTKELQEQVKS
ncbi:hypothetical protein ACWT_3510 [Actinoplanes sp. SE50]|uniref:hypothetical protein n=1 Tax=unclassified Actinoplanes TaxID=2626549 RepID=UPI00023EBD44|nr:MULTISPECIES: hypothetical protein [unclassified Actinoplanes]AEV84533.1 hypothetical protein ACPL_3638 [Actinoplanes sp. SE50/110]ATO82925.1 hypothetical protein ACWT_3510 [Actinoplanes sp. SE50]SLM00333.1 hypothetical protein ACSP50_3565 [Actinoplanes sp. SE50/110]